MLQEMRSRAKDESGFTLIELLVVILIIGILAAIALPTFLGQKDKAKDASAKSNARNAVTQIESCLVDETAVNCVGNAQILQARGAGSAPVITDSDNYSITSNSATSNTFTITKANGTYARTCTRTGSTNGGCPTSLSW